MSYTGSLTRLRTGEIRCNGGLRSSRTGSSFLSRMPLPIRQVDLTQDYTRGRASDYSLNINIVRFNLEI